MKAQYIILILFILIFISGCNSYNYVEIDNKKIEVEIAITEEDRNKSIKILKEKRDKRRKEYLEKGKYELLSSNYRRQIILEEVNYTCEFCKNKEWLGKSLWLEIHHKDGNTKNNIRENLIVVCPNCHSVIDENYRFRGRKHIK